MTGNRSGSNAEFPVILHLIGEGVITDTLTYRENVIGNLKREVIPIHKEFFNDGHWYVLASCSLGGSGLGPREIAEKLGSEDENVINDLLRRGVCLPLYFGCDCALDDVIFVLGDLNEREQAEWLGRIRMRLEVPCGELMLMGGGMEEDFEVALQHFEPPDEHFRFFQKLRLEPGAYLVEMYAFLGSYPVNEVWEKLEIGKTIEEWWDQSYPGKEYPEWVSFCKDEGYVDSEQFDLVEHIVRIVPSVEEIPLPPLDQDYKWVGEFKMRRPAKCPVGLKLQDIISD